MKNKLVVALLIIAGFWGFTSISHKSDKPCINVYIDYGSLNNQIKVIGCIDSNNKESALEVLAKSNINIEGTAKYGNQIVCRVNSLPGPDKESCETMPPEDAYWAVIVKQKPVSKWGWAQTGISDVYLEPGDSIGLVYTENEVMRWPD